MECETVAEAGELVLPAASRATAVKVTGPSPVPDGARVEASQPRPLTKDICVDPLIAPDQDRVTPVTAVSSEAETWIVTGSSL